MRSKRLLQIFVLLALLFSPMGSVQTARASTPAGAQAVSEAVIVNRDLNFWDATYVGLVSDSIFEKWRFEFTATHSFVVTASSITGGLVPQLTLLDASNTELAQGTNTLTSTQPAGTYYVQVQPQSGSGFYFLTIREVVNTQPSVSTNVSPASLNVGESALATVSLNNVPAAGYTSAEFTCTYNATLLAVSNITIGSLFGADAAAAVNNPQNGSFIVAIAGSNGNKATTSGPAFTFTVTALQAGQSTVECTVRVSQGNNVLTPLSSTGTAVTITGSAPTATQTSTPVESPTPTGTLPTATSTPVESPTPTGTLPTATSTPVESPTPTGTLPTATSTPVESPTPTGTLPTATSTPVESPTPTGTLPTATSTPVESPTPTGTLPTATSTPIPSPTPLPAGTLNGQVLAGKPVTVNLFDATNTLVATVPANPDGTFSLTAPAGTYAVVATAPGFLSTAGSATITSGGTTSLPNVTLLAGDIDGNNVIDQLDAMTIGMNYNTATPAAADLNNDGTINVLDLELLAANYRETGPIVWQ
ncbi:MAG TPA: carboxypeptidase regulatory-like domain-containing protein [Anaerolineales bacterium]|nr:carboxypeptidase regulatory-like domain-containing protein [Anaerolineales bacterium]